MTIERIQNYLLNLINSKCYMQLKIKVKFYQEKVIRFKSYYNQVPFQEEQEFKQREFLALTLDDLARILKVQSDRFSL